MASKCSDSSSNGSIAAQRDEIARQLVEAVTQCQDAPAVVRQQAQAQAEIGFIEEILNPIIKENRSRRERLENLSWDDYISNYFSYQNQRFEEELERPLERGAAFAKETKNRALAKAVRHVRDALAAETRQALEESHLLFPKVEDRLRQLRAQADVRLKLTQPRAAEIAGWKTRQTELQAAAHALAAVRSVPDAQEDEGE